ncbi:hypothetical protein J2Y56_002373 [Pseudomonas sp. BE134]|jgi:hypothetical protein|nr:hypothetical protein [Pseudomonas sp. BE134]
MTAESNHPPVDTSSDNTVLQLFPPKLLGSTIPVVGAHCGAPTIRWTCRQWAHWYW